MKQNSKEKKCELKKTIQNSFNKRKKERNFKERKKERKNERNIKERKKEDRKNSNELCKENKEKEWKDRN